MAPAGLTHSSTGLVDLSWNFSLFDNLGGPAGAQAGADGGAQGVAQGGGHFGGITTQLSSVSKVLSCQVQLAEDCLVFKPVMMGQQQQQQQQQQQDFIMVMPSHLLPSSTPSPTTSRAAS